ncbi:MAG: hypothetical protein ACYTA3_02405 [Planctomycetota bacterium]
MAAISRRCSIERSGWYLAWKRLNGGLKNQMPAENFRSSSKFRRWSSNCGPARRVAWLRRSAMAMVSSSSSESRFAKPGEASAAVAV